MPNSQETDPDEQGHDNHLSQQKRPSCYGHHLFHLVKQGASSSPTGMGVSTFCG